MDRVFEEHAPIAGMHFAALSQVGESMQAPGLYWQNNVMGSLNLIQAAVEHDCMDFVFSSTCATYGDQDGLVLDEDSPQHPINAYGASKRAVENILADYKAAYGLNHVIFRYFNIAGADPDGEVGEFHQPETHLMPLILDAIELRIETLMSDLKSKDLVQRERATAEAISLGVDPRLVLSGQFMQNSNYNRHARALPELEKRVRLLSAEYRELQKARPIDVVPVAQN